MVSTTLPSTTTIVSDALNLTTHGSNDTTTVVTPEFPAYFRITSMLICCIILIFGVLGNIMVPIVILRTKDMRNSTNIFLINLSFADLLVLIICTPIVIIEVNTKPETWILGESLCKIIPFVELTVAHASVLTILAITFERYYAICEPLRAGYVCTKTRAIIICVLAWFVAAFCTSPSLVISQLTLEKYSDHSDVFVCWSLIDPLWVRAFYLSSISIFFLLPLFALTVLYVIIAKHLMANPSIAAGNSNRNALRYRKQVVLMLGTVVLTFFICLLPFRAFTIWIILAPEELQLSYLYGYESSYCILFICRFMLYLNSAINPILYNLMSSKFRDGFQKLCGIKKGCKLQIGRRSTLTTSGTTISSQPTIRSTPISSEDNNSITGMNKKKSTMISIENNCVQSDVIVKKFSINNNNIEKLQESYV